MIETDKKVIDDFLHPIEFENIRWSVSSDLLLWNCTGVLSTGKDVKLRCPEQFNKQFVHNFDGDLEQHKLYKDQRQLSHTYNVILMPVLRRLDVDIKKVIKAKVNNNLATNEIMEYGFHIDTSEDCYTAIFYMNTNNGYTLFEDGDKVDSIANRVLIFDSSCRHSVSTHTDTTNRYVLNINWLK